MYKFLKTFFYFLKSLLRIPINIIRHNRIDRTTRFGGGVRCDRSQIGKYNYIGKNSSLNSVKIGNYCSIASNVHIGGMDHNYKFYSTSPLLNKNVIYQLETVIGHDVWIGTGCIIKLGISIGNGSVIGAGSFVNKDIPPNSIAFGSPAIIHKERLAAETFIKIQQSEFWNYPPSKAIKILSNI